MKINDVKTFCKKLIDGDPKTVKKFNKGCVQILVTGLTVGAVVACCKGKIVTGATYYAVAGTIEKVNRDRERINKVKDTLVGQVTKVRDVTKRFFNKIDEEIRKEA